MNIKSSSVPLILACLLLSACTTANVSPLRSLPPQDIMAAPQEKSFLEEMLELIDSSTSLEDAKK